MEKRLLLLRGQKCTYVGGGDSGSSSTTADEERDECRGCQQQFTVCEELEKR